MTKKRTYSRRSLLRDSAAAAAGGAALLAQVRPALGQAPAVVTQRRFKAWISRGEGPGRTTLQEATLRPITGTLEPVAVHHDKASGPEVLCEAYEVVVFGMRPAEHGVNGHSCSAGRRVMAVAVCP